MNKIQKIQCKSCKYEWPTKSDKMFVSCPNCLKKTKNVIGLEHHEHDKMETSIINHNHSKNDIKEE